MTQLADFESVIRLFCKGISGRPFQIHSTSAIKEPFSYHPNRPPITGTFNLYFSNNFDFLKSQESNRRAYLFFGLQQIGFYEFGTYLFNIETARTKIEQLRTVPIPSRHKESELELFYRHFKSIQVAQTLFQLIEYARVEHLLLRKYPGSRRYRQELQPYFDAIHQVQPSTELGAELNNLSATLHSVPNQNSKLFTVLGPVLERDSNVYASARATHSCYERLQPLIQDSTIQVPDSKIDGHHPIDHIPLEIVQRQSRVDEWQQEITDLETELLFLAGQIELAESEGSTDGVGLIDSQLEKLKAVQTNRDQRVRQLNIEKSSLGISSTSTQNAHASYRYDEWDYLNNQWLQNWCLLHEYSLVDEQLSSAEKIKKAIQPHVQPIRRMFEQVRPTGMKRVSHQVEGDELDPSAIVDLKVDIKAGNAPDDRLYSRKDPIHRDIATVILVDLSASTDSPLFDQQKQSVNANHNDSKPQDLRDPFFDDPVLNGRLDMSEQHKEIADTRRVIDIQREAVLLLATALESLEDLYAVYGFSGYGKENVELFVAKEFNQTLTQRSIGAIASMKPKRSTRMGPAIRHATHRLLSIGSSMKVLLVVSDGFPQDCDYGPDRTDREYGIQDTAMALREARLKGIQSFCVTVDHAGHDYLRRMCPQNRYVVIDELTELPVALSVAYRNLTGN